jgi:hypothetical protein
LVLFLCPTLGQYYGLPEYCPSFDLCMSRCHFDSKPTKVWSINSRSGHVPLHKEKPRQYSGNP